MTSILIYSIIFCMHADFYSLGAAEEVTGSKHILEIDGQSYLIDCGAFQGSRAEADRKNRNLGIPVDRIENAILTHGHFDHCGLLPLLVKQGYKGNIYATPATRDIASLIMMDSANIQARDAKYLQSQAQKKVKNSTGLRFILNRTQSRRSGRQSAFRITDLCISETE